MNAASGAWHAPVGAGAGGEPLDARIVMGPLAGARGSFGARGTMHSGAKVAAMLVVVSMLAGCTPQMMQQMHRDHEKRMKQFAYAHAERQKAWENIWKPKPAKDDDAGGRTRRVRTREGGWSHIGAAPRQPGEAGPEPERSAWDEFWGIEPSEPAKPQKPKSEGTGEYQDWSIECGAYDGAQRREMADRMAKLLKDVPEIDAERVQVQHSPEQSRVLYGEYSLEYVYSGAKKDSAPVIELNDKIRGDVDFIRKLAIGNAHPFLQARPIEKPQPMQGRPEWDLRNAAGVYSLHVGVTYATPTLEDYKGAALQWVQVLREDGHDAYYYHDPDDARVSVCVGTFGPDAVVETRNRQTGTTERVYAAAVNALRARDESFQYNLENGHIVYRHVINKESNRKERIPNLSFLVKIPRKGERLGAAEAPDGARSGARPGAGGRRP